MDRPQTPTPTRDWRALPRWLLVAPALLLAIALVAGIGPDHGPIVGIVAVAFALFEAGPVVLAYALASAGWGMLLAPLLLSRSPDPDRATESRWLCLALGLGIMLTLTHLCGWLLGWRGIAGAVACYGPTGLGIASFLALASRAAYRAREVQHRITSVPRVRISTLCSCIGASVLLVASCSTPGLLWASEFGGFDALSYHLQLPREWLGIGRITPLVHNVYSYLPSYIEGAYTHLGAMRGGAASGNSGGMFAGHGMSLISCQLLHALITLLAAGLVGRCCDAIAGMADLDDRARAASRMAGWAFTLVTPWSVVVGSLAYNEMGVIAFGAAAMLVSMRTSLAPLRRAGACAFFVGMACGCKPTALFMVGPVAGLLLLARTPMRAWWRSIAIGSLVGTLTLLPWLLRNWMVGGNPVFPQFSAVFGHAHWTIEQVERYKGAHHSDLSVLRRIALLVWPASGDPARPDALVHRGLMHAQFFAFLPLVAISLGGTLMSRWRRRLFRPVALLAAGFALQLIAWLCLTHLQSRFLLPLLLTGAPLVGLAMAMAVSEHALARAMPAGGEPSSTAGEARGRRRSIRIRRRTLLAMINLGLIVQAAWVVLLFGQQGRGNPNAYLLTTPGQITGEGFLGVYQQSSEAERRTIDSNLSPAGYARLKLGPAAGTLYLLGDSTPLYFPSPVLYHTTYDASPLGELMAIYPNDSARWARELWAMGVRHVLISMSELERLQGRSGWYDPRVTPMAAKSFLDQHADLLRAWPEQGRGLYRLRTPTPEPGAGA